MPNASLLSIKDLNHKTFRIPAYQSGYRWTRRQIKDLVCDLQEFYDNNTARIYCLQPIVLEKKDDGNGVVHYNVIDGQQRLTSLYLLSAAYRWLKKRPLNTFTDYDLQYEGKETTLQKLLFEVGSCAPEDYEEKLIQWESLYTDIDSQNVINVLKFLTAEDAGWCPEDMLHDFHRCLNENKKDICVIWHELEGTDDNTDKAIETFANINANKIPLTDAELIKAVLMQAYGNLPLEAEEQATTNSAAVAVLQESTFANQWETIERGLNDESFWCFFVKKTGGYKTRIDLLFEIWLATKGIVLPVDDHALYRTLLTQLNSGDVKEIWGDIVTIYETLRDWYQGYYIYHIIGACSLLGKKETNAEFVCSLYHSYNALTKKQFRDTLKNCLKERYEAVLEKTDGLRSLTYENHYNEVKSVLLLFNIALLLNTYDKCKANTAERFPFDYYKSSSIEVEHINPRHPDTKATAHEIDAWKTDIRAVVEENNKTTLIEPASPRSKIGADIWENAAEVHSIGNLTLVDKQLNIGFSNGSFRDKRNHVLSAMFGETITIKTGEKQYDSSLLLPGARWVFLRQWRTDIDSKLSLDLMTRDFWSKAERDFYVNELEKSLHFLLGISSEKTKEEVTE